MVPLIRHFFQVVGAVSLNPRAGERAVLIKNNQGDWGIVTGKWTGFRRGVPGIRGKKVDNIFVMFFQLGKHSRGDPELRRLLL